MSNIFIHQMPKRPPCDHEWSEPPPDWDKSKDFVPICNKCGVSFIYYIHMEMP